MWVAAVVLYDHAFWFCPLASECQCCRRSSGPGHVRRVAWGYRVKPGGELYLLVSGGGGDGGVIVDGDQVQQEPWSVKGCRVAVPACAWSLCLTGGTSVSGALCSGMDRAAWCRCTVRVACLLLLSASSRMVGGVQSLADRVGYSCFVPPLLGVSCSLGRGLRCWCWKVLYAVSMSLGPGMVRPAFVAHAAEVCLEDAAAWPLRIGEERCVVGSALDHDPHLRGGDVHYGDGGLQEA